VSVMSGLALETGLPNLKFVPSAVLELLASNAPKFMGSRDRDYAHFSEIFVRGHVGTIPGNTPAKFDVRIFSRFGADRQTDRQTDQKRPISVVDGDHAHLARHTTSRKSVQPIL